MIEKPHLILRPTREILLEPLVSMRGRFTVELIDAKTQRVKRKLEFDNLITDTGLNAIFTVSGFLGSLTTYCGVGTGSTTPANGDANLVSEITPASSNRTNVNGGTADSSGYTAGSPDFAWGKRVRLFDETQANGNLTEIGFFDASSAGSMWTRQLLKDGTGTPTTITKTSSDQLKVTYEIRVYPPIADVTGNVSISAVNYPYTLRAINVDQGGAWRNFVSFVAGQAGIVGGTPGVQAVAGEDNTVAGRTGGTLPGFNTPSIVTPASYSAGNFYRDITYQFEPNDCNFATGIGQVDFMPVEYNGYTGCFGIFFTTTKVPKDNTKRFVMNVRQTVARYP